MSDSVKLQSEQTASPHGWDQNFEQSENTKESLSPSVRRLVEVNQINTSDIVGTGRGGRLTKEDILTALKQGPQMLSEQEEGNREIFAKQIRIKFSVTNIMIDVLRTFRNVFLEKTKTKTTCILLLV